MRDRDPGIGIRGSQSKNRECMRPSAAAEDALTPDSERSPRDRKHNIWWHDFFVILFFEIRK